ncbi:extensin [Streptomyces sp. NPDC029526]|uniref:extensin n=1 Tax=Streptomyces sp. NPDC029526 TaxID=3155728 RepID=UPI003408ED4D
MADEQNGWLDRETAERLLSGEPSAVADPAAREQAERLADALGALAAPPPPPGRELPGEAAALAAFRAARAERGERTATGAREGEPDRTAVADGGLVRLGGPDPHPSGTARGLRRARYLRFGLAAALTAGMVGGAAYLAGTGAQTGPSGGPVSDPGASVSASVPPPGRPLVSPRPSGGDAADPAAPGGAPDGAPERAPGAGTASDDPRAAGDEDTATGRRGTPGPDAVRPGGGHGSGWKHAVAACRALRDGKDVGSAHRRRLDSLAGGSSRVHAYCKGVLAAADAGAAGKGGEAHGDDRHDGGPDRGAGGKNGKGSGDRGKGGGSGGGDDRPGRSDRHHARGSLAAASAAGPASLTVALAVATR